VCLVEVSAEHRQLGDRCTNLSPAELAKAIEPADSRVKLGAVANSFGEAPSMLALTHAMVGNASLVAERFEGEFDHRVRSPLVRTSFGHDPHEYLGDPDGRLCFGELFGRASARGSVDYLIERYPAICQILSRLSESSANCARPEADADHLLSSVR